MNCPDFRDLPSPASHGYGTVHSMAKLMSVMAEGGELRGQRLLSKKTYDRFFTKLTDRFDRVVLRKIAYGPGLMIEPIDVGKVRLGGTWGVQGESKRYHCIDRLYIVGSISWWLHSCYNSSSCVLVKPR
jgi:hypothetical protein